jgi:hypothetical protein
MTRSNIAKKKMHIKLDRYAQTTGMDFFAIYPKKYSAGWFIQ